MQTLLSRLRPYRFKARNADDEREIIRRVFRDSRPVPDVEGEDSENGLDGDSPGLVAAYLDSFTPQPSEKLLPLAAFFVAAVTRAAVVLSRNRGVTETSPALGALGSYCARIAENSGLERTDDPGQTISTLVSRTSGFEGRSFSRFLFLCLRLVSEALVACDSGADRIRVLEIWKKRTGDAQGSHATFNQRPELGLESLFLRLKEDMAG
jgi:hypothetical protein